MATQLLFKRHILFTVQVKVTIYILDGTNVITQNYKCVLPLNKLSWTVSVIYIIHFVSVCGQLPSTLKSSSSFVYIIFLLMPVSLITIKIMTFLGEPNLHIGTKTTLRIPTAKQWILSLSKQKTYDFWMRKVDNIFVVFQWEWTSCHNKFYVWRYLTFCLTCCGDLQRRTVPMRCYSIHIQRYNLCGCGSSSILFKADIWNAYVLGESSGKFILGVYYYKTRFSQKNYRTLDNSCRSLKNYIINLTIF